MSKIYLYHLNKIDLKWVYDIKTDTNNLCNVGDEIQVEEKT